MKRDRTGVRRVLWLAGWPLRFLLLTVLRGYQRFVSPLFGPSCRYAPCCSSYAITAVRRHGAAKGTVLTIARLVRCNPWAPGGIDRVPRRGQWRSPVAPDGTPRISAQRGSGRRDPAPRRSTHRSDAHHEPPSSGAHPART